MSNGKSDFVVIERRVRQRGEGTGEKRNWPRLLTSWSSRTGAMDFRPLLIWAFGSQVKGQGVGGRVLGRDSMRTRRNPALPAKYWILYLRVCSTLTITVLSLFIEYLGLPH